MTLKERLEAIWNDPRIASPCHFNKWNETGTGYLLWSQLKLFWQHGRKSR